MRRHGAGAAAGRQGPPLRWRPRPGNLIDRRGAALASPILVAAGLNVAAGAGLADIAGLHAVYASLIRIQWPWLCALPAAFALSAIGYFFAYRRIYAAEGGYELSRRQLTAVVAAGFDGLFSTGGIRPDGLVLEASGASRRVAAYRALSFWLPLPPALASLPVLREITAGRDHQARRARATPAEPTPRP